MDLDEDWCRKHLEGAAQGYVRSKCTLTAKKNRMGPHPKYGENLTTFIHNETERQTTLRVIGRTKDNLGKNLIHLHCSAGASDLYLLLQKMPIHRLTKVPCFLSKWVYLIQCLGHAFAIQVMSDLHLEYSFHCPGNSTVAGYEAFDCKPCAPVLALLGDVGLVSQNGLFVFLRRQLLKYEKILYVMGNHEFYDSYFVCQISSCSLACWWRPSGRCKSPVEIIFRWNPEGKDCREFSGGVYLHGPNTSGSRRYHHHSWMYPLVTYSEHRFKRNWTTS